MSSNNTEDLWNPYKELKNIVWTYLNDVVEDISLTEFEDVLRKNKQSFYSLLQHPGKNTKSRDDLKKGMVDGINVRGIGHQILSKELYQEAVILSDMFNLNEFVALDLLCTAQIQMPYYPDLPRGLVAILLYYDGRKALVTTLLYLVQARNGIQWTVNVRPEISQYITEYTDELMEGGLFNRIFELLRSLDLSKELDLLQQNLALGGPKHRRQVTDLFNDIRHILADIVFSWSAQSGLTKEPTLGLISYLREVKIDVEATGKIDDINLYLVAALLCSLDLSVLHTREDGEEAVMLLPILNDSSYIQSVVNEFISSKSNWECSGIHALCTFGLSVCLASLRIIPQNMNFQDVLSRDETFADIAIDMNVFTFIYDNILENSNVYKEPFIYKRLHTLLTDFIVYMYPKVKDMRMNADDTSRTIQAYIKEGLGIPSNLNRSFEYLLLTIYKFYSNDKLNTDYAMAFWSPIEINSNSNNSQNNFSYNRAPSRSVSLFRFVKLCSDMLPTVLFVPYIKMLSGISSTQQTARLCFNMLKNVGFLSSNISWDHFFMSFAQYYQNLRQENDSLHRNRSVFLQKNVSPQEIEGLNSVLILIKTVCEYDEFSRLALCEHPGWSPLTILLGLVSCSIPIPLKAELLLTLSALSKSNENAQQMWENLENSQILVTIPSTSNYAPRGIKTELDEVESRLEEYPLTRSLLTLLDVLTNFGIPRNLGAGPRKPGFEPYLTFIINSVFLKYNTRQYRNVKEKWEVALGCLSLFEKFLNNYDPKLSDFDGINDLNMQPGYYIMVQLNNRTEFLYLILDIIDEGTKYFDSYISFNGEDIIKKTTLCCLNIILRSLILQSKFFHILSNSNKSSLILSGLNKLLLSINRKSNKPDHCINIAKYVSYNILMIQHSNVAIKILNAITSSPALHSQFISILLSSDDNLKIIKNGFCEILDNITSDDNIIVESKKEVIKLIKQCLIYNSPNLSHILMGFDLRKPINKTVFQFPGVLNFPRTCLHSLVSILDTRLKKYSSKHDYSFLELCYNLLYNLSANNKTSEPILRFIRHNKSFFIDHIIFSCNNISNNIVNELNICSFLLKTLAIELKITSHNKQISYLQMLTSFLINAPTHESLKEIFCVVQQNMLIENKVATPNDLKLNNYMTGLLKYMQFNESVVEMPQWEFFESNALSTIIKQCEKKTSPKLIDLKKLHQILYDELKSLHGTAVLGQIQAITQEIPKVLKYALDVNKYTEKAFSIINFSDSWRQVSEVIILYMPKEILSNIENQIVSISFSINILKNAVESNLLPEVARFLSGALLIMLNSLKKCHFRENRLKKVAELEDENMNITKYYSSCLKEILTNLVEWILISDVTDGELRINLYAALAQFLQFTNTDIENEEINIENSLYISRLDSSRLSVNQKERQIKLSNDITNIFNEKLLEVLCHDCIGGQEICKILAMSSFSHLLQISGNVNWILYLSSRGYLKHIIQSILESDKDLKNILEDKNTSIKPLYLYLAKMLLLTRLSNNRIGAEMILEQKLLGVFSNMTVFSYHPEISKTWSNNSEIFDDFMPNNEQKYLQIFTPTLEICNAILTTLGNENQSAISQIMYFVFSHLDVVELVLRSGHPDLGPQSLRELCLVTFILCRTANNNLLNIMDNPNLNETNRAQMYRLQKLMLSLLPKFIISETLVKKILINNESNAIFQTSERLIYCMQIMSNLTSYARNIVANHGIEHSGVGVIFYPSLSDPLLNTFNTKTLGNLSDQEQSLGVIVQQLISTVSYQHKQKITYDMLSRKLKDIRNMNSAELNNFVGEISELSDLTLKKERAYEIISDRLDKKKKEMEYCGFIIENCLYLIWVHLDYYMLKAIPKAKNLHLRTTINISAEATLPNAMEATWKVSTDVISNLKQGLVSLFNDSFSKQLLETAQGRTEADRSFVEALLRKIKRLVQFVPVK